MNEVKCASNKFQKEVVSRSESVDLKRQKDVKFYRLLITGITVIFAAENFLVWNSLFPLLRKAKIFQIS